MEKYLHAEMRAGQRNPLLRTTRVSYALAVNYHVSERNVHFYYSQDGEEYSESSASSCENEHRYAWKRDRVRLDGKSGNERDADTF